MWLLRTSITLLFLLLFACSVDAQIAFDAHTGDCTGTGTITCSHTPVGTPRGVLVVIHAASSADSVNTVTYGGATMSEAVLPRLSTFSAQSVYAYYLGSSIPTGAQNAVVTVNNANSKRVNVVTFTATRDTEVLDADNTITGQTVSNPSVTLEVGGRTALAVITFLSGQDDTTGFAPLAGWTSMQEVDSGTAGRGYYRLTTTTTSNITAGWTQTADEAQAIALAMAEVSAVVGGDLTVCASGCTYTNGQLQTAINDAEPGDTILLQQGFQYEGSFTLPRHAGTTYATIRTGVTSTGSVVAESTFPGALVRMTPALAASANLAKIRTTTQNGAALSTADPSGGFSPQYWRIKWLEFNQNANATVFGSGTIIQCGSDSSTVVTSESLIPDHFEFIQNYIHGDAFSGQYRGVSIHCDHVTFRENYVSDIKALTEGQALWINSSRGPWTIENNYLSGGTEVLFFGGSGGCCRPVQTLTAVVSATNMTLDGRDGLRVGYGVLIDVGGTLESNRQFTNIASCGTSTPGALCTQNAITVSPALSAAPSVGATVRWGLVNGIVGDATIRYNYVTRPLSMRNDILSAPATLSASGSGSGGTLATGTYYYKVVARAQVATSSTQTNAIARSAASVQASASVTGPTASITLTWPQVTNATTYRVYGRTNGGQNIRFEVTSGAACSAGTCTYVDTGSAGTTENVPTTAGSKFLVKNTFEIKNLDGGLVEGNIFEHSWLDGQTGYVVLFTPGNTGPTTRVANITFKNNVVRHGAGGMQLTGRNVSITQGGADATDRTTGISITNNLFYNLNSTFGGSNSDLLLVTASFDPLVYASSSHQMGPKDVTIEHNTIDNSGRALVFLDLFKSGLARPVENFIFRNNLTNKASTGITGNNSCTQGSGCWTAYTSGTTVWNQNVVAAATCGSYPTGTICPTVAALQADYVGYSAQNYRLIPASAYNNAGTDGLDLGADHDAIDDAVNIAINGVFPDPNAPPPAAPPRKRYTIRFKQ